jgi:predicted GNAT family N-acyltransferase
MTDNASVSGGSAGESPAGTLVVSRFATTTEDRLAAFRLRYEVYIAEQGKPYPEADHVDRYLSDELDADGVLIIVESDDQIVGTVRANHFNSPMVRARHAHVFELGLFSAIRTPQIAVCSRLATLPEHRHATARALLFDAIYEYGLEHDTRLCFVSCAPLLVRMFRRYGFREYAPPIKDPVVGTLHRNLLVLDDLEYLQRIQSPFAAIAARANVTHQDRPWLTHLFEKYRAHYVHA